MHACKETVELDIECTSKRVWLHIKGYSSCGEVHFHLNKYPHDYSDEQEVNKNTQKLLK